MNAHVFQVVFAEQQIAKRRLKREYQSPRNAMWSKQWYLVSVRLSFHHNFSTSFSGLITSCFPCKGKVFEARPCYFIIISKKQQ